MKNPGVTAVEARKTLCLMSDWRLCIVIQRSMFQHYTTTVHTKTSITVILSGVLLNWDLHWIFTSVIINSAAADKDRQEPSLDRGVIETLITWNVLSMVLSDNNWAAPEIILTHYISLIDPGVDWGELVRAECWYILWYCVDVIDVFLIVMFHS